jgi:predicted esterase
LHGYGQLANYFIRKFDELGDHVFVVAVEGLHRFYLKGASGRVGASWMTKESRLDDIRDNQHYLEKTLEPFLASKQFENKTLLGFSQGGATAARYFFEKNPSFDHFVLWASVFPPDLEVDQEVLSTKTSKKKCTFVIGTKDDFFDLEAQNEVVKFYETKNFETFVFDGNHDIDLTSLKTIIS